MERNFDIITGFGRKSIDLFASGLKEAFGQCHIRIIEGCPPAKASLSLVRLVDEIEKEIGDALDAVAATRGSLQRFVVGHSLGSLFGLDYAVRRKRMEGIAGLFLIDGPLASSVKVQPPEFLFFSQFSLQYGEREAFACQCECALATLTPTQRKRIRTFGSEETDPIVPIAAQRLPDVTHVALSARFDGHDLQRKIEPLIEAMRPLVEKI